MFFNDPFMIRVLGADQGKSFFVNHKHLIAITLLQATGLACGIVLKPVVVIVRAPILLWNFM